MNRYDAKICLRTEDEGGLTQRAFSGMQSSIEIAGDLVACKIIYGAEGTEMTLGEEHLVQIELSYESEISDRLVRNYHFGINVGGRVISHGVIM